MTVIAQGEVELRLSPQSLSRIENQMTAGFKKTTVDPKLAPGSASRLENDISGATGRASTKASGQFRSAFAGVGAAVGASFAAAGAIRVFGSFITEAREAEKVGRLTEAVIKSTGGVANVTAKQIEDLAESLSKVAGVDDDLIQGGLNVLATFTNVKNIGGQKIFDVAAQSALDMSAALGTDFQGSIIQVGKALNDPIKGITALSRVGVSFTEDQKKLIKSLVESGDVLGAQKVILKELQTEFGGAAAAAADPFAKLKVTMDNVKESLGIALLPILNSVATAFANMSPGMQKAIVVGGLLIGVAAALAPLFLVLGPVIAGVGAALAVLVSPITLVVAAVALLAIVIVKNWDTIKEATLTAFNAVKGAIEGAFNWVRDNWPLLLAILTGPIGLAVLAITTHWETIKAAFGTAIEFIKGVVGSGFEFVRNTVVTVLTTIGAMFSATWAAVTSATSAAFSAVQSIITSVISVVTGAIVAFVGAVISGFARARDGAVSALGELVGFVASLPGKIIAALGNVGGILVDAGRRIMDGLISGIKDGIGKLGGVVKGIAGKIVDWKGPLDFDARLLIPSGEIIMAGLTRGIRESLPDLRRQLGAVTATVGAMSLPAPQVNLSAIRSAVGSAGSPPTASSFAGAAPASTNANHRHDNRSYHFEVYDNTGDAEGVWASIAARLGAESTR